MKYQILCANNSSALELEVNKLIALGCTPFGGVSVYVLDGVPQFAQAMRWDKEPSMEPIPPTQPQSGMVR
jgi:hypothetical protein